MWGISRPVVQNMEVYQKGDPSTGLFGDNKDATYYKLQQDLEAKMKENNLLTQNLKVSKASLKKSQDIFFSTNDDEGESKTI